jgi:hypothetical protein
MMVVILPLSSFSFTPTGQTRHSQGDAHRLRDRLKPNMSSGKTLANLGPFPAK